MSVRLPERLVHRGIVAAAGFFLEAAGFAVDPHRRMLALWSPGTRIERLLGGWLVRLPASRPVRVATAPGLPLVSVEPGFPDTRGTVLLGAPLSPRELQDLHPPAGGVAFLRGGEWICARPDGPEEDPAAWLDVGSFETTAVFSLGKPVEIPTEIVPPPRPVFDPRSELGDIAPAAPEVAEVIAALSQIAAKEARRLAVRGSPPAAAGSPPRWRLALRELTLRVLAATGLARVVSHRHAQYIRRMIEMFESGDIAAALRHAIPLGSSEESGVSRIAWSPPSPRADLEIRPGLSVGRSLLTSENLYAALRRIYRETFARLEAQGRIEEAAFLLAEVLQEHEEAVAFLDRHGRLRLAAEMAEARGLNPGIVIRQWFLAGDRERAMAVARRTGAFLNAIYRLENRGKKEEGRHLRMLWAADLAAAGDYSAAVDVAVEVPEAGSLIQVWIDRAIEQGGEPGGRMLARKAGLPGPFAPIRAAVLGFLDRPGPEEAAARLAFALALSRGPKTPATRVLARATVRAMVRDGRIGPADLQKLVKLSEDAALKADTPALPSPAAGSWLARKEVWRIDVDPWDVGGAPVWDAAYLPNGRLAVALGEAGVRLLSKAGRPVAILDPPAHRLVVSDHGDRAIALGRRGETWRLSRLDFAARTARPWTDVRIGAHAADYDGACWYVAGANGLVAIEVGSPAGHSHASQRFDGPWGLSDLPGEVLQVVRSPTRLFLLLVDDSAPEVWTYELPSRTLRSREPLQGNEDFLPLSRLSASGRVVQPLDFRLHLPDLAGFGDPQAVGDWIAIALTTPSSVEVYLFHPPSAAVRAVLTLARATRAALRLTAETLTVADDLGRILVLDLENRQVRRNLRLS